MKQDSPVYAFFINAFDKIIEKGYEQEIEDIRDIPPLQKISPNYFFYEYVWVVLNAGMKEQVARKIYNRFMESFERDDAFDTKIIGHLGKRQAVEFGILHHKLWLENLKKESTSIAQIDYLETLPWIGKITKYHLARNIGIDTVKPDRHLQKLADHFGFRSPMEMCEAIQNEQKEDGQPAEKLGTIDVILWRYMNLTGGKIE